jgi:hypothetical protein
MDILNDSKFRDFLNFIDLKSDHYPRFMERLVDKGLFEKNKDGYSWFKHELVQKCLDDRLQNEFRPIYEEYHNNAAAFYEKLLER